MIIRFVATVLSLAFLVEPTLAQDTAFATFDLASEPVLDDPHDLTIGPGGLLYVADKFANKITILDPNTLAIVGSFGDGALFGVHDISFGPDGRAYIAVTGLNRVDVYEVNGTQGVFVESYDSLARTEGAYAHPNGRLYAMASGIGTLVAFENGEPLVATRGLNGAHDVAGALDGTIWVADNVSRRLVQFDEDLNFLRVLDDAELGLIGARYIAIDDFGRIVAIDQDAHRALLIDPDAAEGSRLVGVIGDGLPGLGPGKFDNPEGVAAHGNSYFFSDSDNNRIVKYSVIIN